jgi:hypothetical protein
MYVFGNHLQVSIAKEQLITNDSGISAMFEQEWVSRQNDQQPISAKWEYVGWIEEIFEFNYKVINNLVFFCNWVKANYIGNNAMVKRDEYGFTLVNFSSFTPISDQSFVFSIHVE